MSKDKSFTGSQMVVLPQDYFDHMEFISPDIAEEIEESRAELLADLHVDGLKSSVLARAAKTTVSAAVIYFIPFYPCF